MLKHTIERAPLDRGVERLDDVEAEVMVALRGDAFEVFQDDVTDLLHLGQVLPP